uniref:Uncharacterized protein n=1 Tax=Dicentrarchus labrax TaxID=13489 RepID=A0A8P4K4S2_DICLA
MIEYEVDAKVFLIECLAYFVYLSVDFVYYMKCSSHDDLYFSGRLPYQALVNQTLDIEVKGLPNDFTLKKPSFYGRKQLEMILKAAEQISFQISAAAKPLHSSVEEAVAEAVPIIEGNELISVIWFPFKGTSNACSVCGADFYDPDKNRKRKWRSWSQCLVCHGWSHTACGFKRNMCAKCHTE